MKFLKFRSFIIFFFLAGGFFILGNFSLAATADHLVISEIQVAGVTSDDEFIEIYNPTTAPIDLEVLPIKLHIRNSAGTDQNRALTFINKMIPAHGYFLIGPSSGYSGTTPLDATYSASGNKLVANGGVYISKNISAEVDVIDKVGWGTQPSPGYETTPFTENPSANQSIERKFGGDLGNGEDTNDNSADFTLQTTPNPQNTTSPPKPDLPPGPVCGNSICESGENSLTCPTDCSSPPAEPGVGDVVINEFVSDPAEGEEWIEIYNKKSFDINLTGWTIEDGVGTISTLSGTIAIDGFQIIELSSSKLNNSGDIIKLKKSDGTIIDQVSYGDWNDGNISDNAPKASDPNSTARKTDGQDTDNDLSDFTVTTTLTKGASNIITAPPSEGGGGTPPPPTPSSPPSWPVGSLLINEFVADPTDGSNEWIELYNPTNAAIALADWTIEDGGETVTALSGNVPSLGFYVLEKPKGILNNAGDIIILKDPAGMIIDQATYGDWDDGEKSDNAPSAPDPNSVARKTDGQDSNNDFNDFVVATPTKNATNAGGVAQNNNATYSRDIIINEVLPNPKGDDSQNEFIELKNIGSAEIDLADWKIGDASSKTYTVKAADFASTKIKPNEFFVLYRKVTGIALNNTGTEDVKLLGPDGVLITSIEYSGAVAEDTSYAREEQNYFWTTTPTLGKENVITRKNQPPSAVISVSSEGEINEEIIFDGSDSTDPDGDILTFNWNFGDGAVGEGGSISHTYQTKGKFKVILTVKDSLGATATAENFINIINPDATENFSADGTPLVVVNEALPNPEGSDEGEWIELLNLGNTEIDLSDWKLDDDEGGSRPYKIPPGTVIGPNEFLVFKKEKTKLALNNTYDAVRLLDPDGEIVFETSYDEVPEGATWARDERGTWSWTQTLTPGRANIFTFQEKSIAKKSTTKTSSSKKSSATKYIETTLEEIREQDLGDGVKVKGQAIVLPGILGSQIFYIASEEACPGIQIYMYKKDFPELKLGDLVEVSGVLSEAGGEKRIKVSAKEDIKILENKEPLTPLPIKLAEVEESLEGCLVSASGEVTEKSGSNLYFADDDGELKIYFKSSLDFPKPKLDIGDQIETAGIISQTKTGFRLLPRYETDLKLKTPPEDKTSLELPSNGQKNNVAGILGAAAGVLGLTLVGLGIKTGIFASWWKKIKGL